ncbi:MAG: hypothetical protein DWQ31_14010 [Planctomycetota bacterium]|nr:MAG: hypothetical protein DWQ31_14010 [Planctomycetota bacterium]REJ94609.1 MAG: hypothetical protein DWQ35_07720 [Planctomycetota bacterium]REK29053.1 MAG: hypothetical protein DWQ42_04145 [Planctomycetota bacterium]REK46620.1 MAG: hypothetical protein DWQ46_07040 [Planctomycetota bacterium]
MFAQMDTAKLFPMPVWILALEREEVERVNNAVLPAVEALRAETPSANPGDHWQSRNDLQTLEPFAPLTQVIEAGAREIFEQQGIEYDSFLITGLWTNIRPPGSSHPPHTHPNNYLSGSYYPQVPQGGDTIGFRDPRPETNIIAPRVKRQTEFNARTLMVPVRTGILVMFPAWLPHFVPPNQGKTERISISFNVMFSSYAETISKPKWSFEPNAG